MHYIFLNAALIHIAMFLLIQVLDWRIENHKVEFSFHFIVSSCAVRKSNDWKKKKHFSLGCFSMKND